MIVPDHTEIKDVMVVLWIKDSNISSLKEFVPNHLINILLEMDLAKPLNVPKILTPSLNIPTFPLDQLKPSNLLVINNQYPSLLMPKNGLSIPVVSSLTAENLLITESYLLDIPLTIG